MLAEYDIVYMTRKAVKASALADHLADNAIHDYEPLEFEFPDEEIEGEIVLIFKSTGVEGKSIPSTCS